MSRILKRPHSFNYMRNHPDQRGMAVITLESYKEDLEQVPTEGRDEHWILGEEEKTTLSYAIDFVLGYLRSRRAEDSQFVINVLHIETLAVAIAARPTDPTWC